MGHVPEMCLCSKGGQQHFAFWWQIKVAPLSSLLTPGEAYMECWVSFVLAILRKIWSPGASYKEIIKRQGVTSRRQKTRNYVCIEENSFSLPWGCSDRLRSLNSGDTQNPVGHYPMPPALADIPWTKEAGIDNTQRSTSTPTSPCFCDPS